MLCDWIDDGFLTENRDIGRTLKICSRMYKKLGGKPEPAWVGLLFLRMANVLRNSRNRRGASLYR